MTLAVIASAVSVAGLPASIVIIPSPFRACIGAFCHHSAAELARSVDISFSVGARDQRMDVAVTPQHYEHIGEMAHASKWHLHRIKGRRKGCEQKTKEGLAGNE